MCTVFGICNYLYRSDVQHLHLVERMWYDDQRRATIPERSWQRATVLEERWSSAFAPEGSCGQQGAVWGDQQRLVKPEDTYIYLMFATCTCM